MCDAKDYGVTYWSALRSAKAPIITGFVIGIVVLLSVFLLDHYSTRAYLQRHHCQKRGTQMNFDAFLGPERETIYVCDGGEIVIR